MLIAHLCVFFGEISILVLWVSDIAFPSPKWSFIFFGNRTQPCLGLPLWEGDPVPSSGQMLNSSLQTSHGQPFPLLIISGWAHSGQGDVRGSLLGWQGWGTSEKDFCTTKKYTRKRQPFLFWTLLFGMRRLELHRHSSHHENGCPGEDSRAGRRGSLVPRDVVELPD